MIGRILACAALIAAVFAPVPAAAWGGYGHRTTAKIALANITPETRREIDRLIALEPTLGTPDCRLRNLEEASSWADCIRGDRLRWGYTASWHYRTAPICEEFNPRANCSGGACVTGQIERAAAILGDKSMPDARRLEALAFLVHFVGDVHMPLHSGDNDDRGGNDRVVDYGAVPQLNLHWIWDGPLAERAITSAQPGLIRRYSAAERAELAGGDAAEWGRESWLLARDLIYPAAYDAPQNGNVCGRDLPERTTFTLADIEAQIGASQKRITQAGLRIARLLDEALG
ncbi:S1/P1 nuclease [Altererythrobacter aquiaggeris]|uniref:S1/P1 nuclease n=1 Tax=Aestuarierythrobacter aquiaggeris TaxID=1898396 RepID=UPI003019A353